MGVINEPLGQTHGPDNSDHRNRFDLRDFEKWGQTNGRTTYVKTIITKGRECMLAEWIKKKILDKILILYTQFFLFCERSNLSEAERET